MVVPALGAYMIFNSGMSFYALVEEDKYTLVACTFPVGGSNRKRAAMPKNLHCRHIKKE